MSTPAPSQRLGPYELIEFIGEGGMGEVWRARSQAGTRCCDQNLSPAVLRSVRTRGTRHRRAPETGGGGKSAVHVTMLQNFLDELKRRIP
jgi:hypothetical protein